MFPCSEMLFAIVEFSVSGNRVAGGDVLCGHRLNELRHMAMMPDASGRVN